MSEIMMGTLYDMNKAAIINMPSLTNSEFKKNLKKIKQFFLDKTDKYFMLLNRETYNFTLFNLGNKNEIAMKQTMDDFKECLDNRGRVVSIEQDSTGNYEIWVVDDFNEALVYYLFPYDLGVIEHGTEA
jgi:hypothetical protein